jgi:hypothetical protein
LLACRKRSLSSFGSIRPKTGSSPDVDRTKSKSAGFTFSR